MTPDEILDDAACALGVPAPPPVLVALAETEPDLLTTAWAQGGSWFDSEFFEEAAVVAGAALEEVADELPPPGLMQVRLGGLGGCRRLFSSAPLLEAHRRPQLGRHLHRRHRLGLITL